MSTKEEREGIAYLIRERRGVLQALLTDQKQPRILDDQISDLDAKISELQERKAKLEFRKNNLPKLIAECKEQLADLHRKKDLANPAVEQLLKLQREMQMLSEELGSVDPEVIEMLKQRELQK